MLLYGFRSRGDVGIHNRVIIAGVYAQKRLNIHDADSGAVIAGRDVNRFAVIPHRPFPLRALPPL